MDYEVSDGFKKFVNVVVAILIIAVILMIFSNLAPTSAGAQKAVENQGFTNVTVGTANPFLASIYCADSDSFYFEVKSATNFNDQPVTNMYVCAGFLKGYTIRNH